MPSDDGVEQLHGLKGAQRKDQGRAQRNVYGLHLITTAAATGATATAAIATTQSCCGRC